MCRLLCLSISVIAALPTVSFAQSCGDHWCESTSSFFNCCGGTDPDALFAWRCQSADAGIAPLSDGIITDRPDFTEATSVVGRGVLQLEMGYTFTSDDDTGVDTRSHSYPETLFRYGVMADWLEFRFGWNYANEEVAAARTSGSEDIYLGFKIGLTPQDGIRPEMALIPQMTVPSGGASFTTGETLAGINWLYGWEINEFVSTAGSTQFNRAVDDVTGNSYTEWAQSWTFGYTLTERLGAYTEWYAFLPSGSDTHRPEHYANGGFTVALNDDLLWDIRAGVGLNGAADDYFVGTGLSVRFR